MKKYNEFILNERYHINQDVRHLTKLIYNRINYYLPKLILNKEIKITNFLEDNYNKIKFKNDIIILKLGKNHGAINHPIYNNGCLENLIIYLTIDLSKDELSNKYLINNKIKETINHECQHIIEIYKTGGVLPSSWKFNERLKEHEMKFNSYKKWLDIIHIFYLTEDHEIRSSVSQLLEYLKNNNNDISLITKSDVYIKYENITRLDPNLILNIMYKTYDNFDIILNDFIENVILNLSNKINKVFNDEIFKIRKKSEKCLKKLLRVGNNFINEELCDGKSFIYNIDFSDYIKKL